MAEKANWQPKAAYSERQYRRIDTRVWNDRRFRSFTANGRTVWLFLLTAPRTTSIPGLFPLDESEAARMCGLSLEGFREGFHQPFREGMVEADWGAGLVWLKKASRYEPPTGPNVVAAWRKVARMSLPECPLLWRALAGIREQLREVMATPEPFLEAFAKAFPEPLGEPLGEGLPEPIAPTDDGRRMTEDGSTTSAPPVAAPQGSMDVNQPVGQSGPTEKPRPARRQPSPSAPAHAKRPETARGDPRHAPLVESLVVAFAEARRVGYGFQGGRDAKLVTELLVLADQDESTRGEAAPAEVLRRWRIALVWEGFPACATLADLKRSWNYYATPQKRRAAGWAAPATPSSMDAFDRDIPGGST